MQFGGIPLIKGKNFYSWLDNLDAGKSAELKAAEAMAKKSKTHERQLTWDAQQTGEELARLQEKIGLAPKHIMDIIETTMILVRLRMWRASWARTGQCF
ncbi:MAG: hypothetical protein FH756_01770 [Firmicutes bacterium]|nr:hypothetical protein [Bacillota bacterium]